MCSLTGLTVLDGEMVNNLLFDGERTHTRVFKVFDAVSVGDVDLGGVADLFVRLRTAKSFVERWLGSHRVLPFGMIVKSFFACDRLQGGGVQDLWQAMEVTPNGALVENRVVHADARVQHGRILTKESRAYVMVWLNRTECSSRFDNNAQG
jgi:hypothetical protein